NARCLPPPFVTVNPTKSPTNPRWLRSESGAPRSTCNPPASRSTPLQDEKRNERRAGPVAAGQGTPEGRAWRGHLHKLVRAYGTREHGGRHRQAFGADAIPQELDSIALCRSPVGRVADRIADDTAHRTVHALVGDPQHGLQESRGGAATARARAQGGSRRGPRGGAAGFGRP